MRAAALAAALLLAPGAPRAAAAPGTTAFALDPRVEALSVALMLAEPAEFRRLRPDGPDAYAAAAEAAFAPFSSHPAVARVRSLRRDGAPASALARAALTPGDPLARDLEDFAKASALDAFLAARAEDRLAYAATARRESLRAISPEAALAYMGLPFEGEHRFILAPLLPDDDGAGALGMRPGTPTRGATRFQFDTFERSVTAELCRSAAARVREPAAPVRDHLAAAVGLRVLARDLGERVYLAALRRRASAGLPHLAQAAEGLKDFERERARFRTLEAFLPRLEAVAAIRVDQAELAAREGRRDGALALLEEARGRARDVETSRRMIFLYQDLKENARATALSDELLVSASRRPGLLLDRAGLAAKAGDRAAALRFLAEAGTKGPDEAARRRMTELYLELKDYGSARALLDGLLAASPQDARLRLDRAVAAARTGDREAALRGLAEAAARRPDAELSRRMALLHLELGDPGPARVLLGALVAASPRDPELRVDAASAEAAAGGRAKALRLLAEARALAPAAGTRQRIAFLYQDLKEDALSREMLTEISRDEPAAARLVVDRAARAAGAGDRAAALGLLAQARPLNPTFEDRRLMVSLYQGLGEPAPARELLAGLIAAAPRDPGLRIDRAALEARAGGRAAALDALREARALDPDPGDRRRMALLLQDLKDHAGALTLLEPLAREQPSNSSLRGDLGLCRYLGGDAETAISDLSAALALDPANLSAVLTLGSIHAARGRPDLELALYDAAPSAGGDGALRALIRERREELARGRKR